MPHQQREIYHSENGDRWLLCRDDGGRVFVMHEANLSSGGTRTKIELGDFLGRGKAGPEHHALAGLIGSDRREMTAALIKCDLGRCSVMDEQWSGAL